MKFLTQILTLLNLVDGVGRLNLVHMSAYVSSVYLFFSGSTVGLISFGITSALLAIELYLVPQPKPTANVNADELKGEVDRVAKDLRSLNMKLGFR